VAQDASQIRDEIAETRADLADTVQALAQKADVKSKIRETVADNTAQLQARASDLTERVRQVTPEKAKAGLQTARTNEWLVPAIVAVLVGWLVWRRTGRSR
jgi:ElaB/YqjD/DUF883 family membrane-anchored ribosome-binding protein